MKALKIFKRNSSELKRSLSNPRASGSWPDDVLTTSATLTSDGPATDYDLNLYLKGILHAQSRIYEVCKETELQYAPMLSKLTNNDVFFKREDQQPVFSFKLRGAFNKIASLPDDKKRAGIITCSAGNHAQGVALSASKLKLDNLIVMPEPTPKIKIDSVKKFGGSVMLAGKNFDEAQKVAMEHSEKNGMTLVHPFDDFQVVCGQGTIGMEILKQIPNSSAPEVIFGAVGGGGMMAGIGCYVKQLSSQTKIIGVETFDSNCMTVSLKNNKRTTLSEVGLFADGAAVKTPGKLTFSISQRVIDEMINVTTDDVCQAIKLIFNDTRCVVEPAGALGVAGMMRYIEQNKVTGQSLVCVTSGANMDFDRLRFVSERADRSESLIHVKIPEKHGSFYKLYKVIYPRTVTEFSYRMKAGPVADIMLSFQAKSSEDKEFVISSLISNGYETQDLSENELAKTHVRHLAAGRENVSDEKLMSFEFPESPGALNTFLTKLNKATSPSFNVSLFHYRNHGADIGRVLVGMQVPKSEEQEFQNFLTSLDFICTEETTNPVYVDFLKK